MRIRLIEDKTDENIGYKLFYDLDSTKEYSVLSTIESNGEVKFYRIIDESEEEYEYPSEVFEIVKEKRNGY